MKKFRKILLASSLAMMLASCSEGTVQQVTVYNDAPIYVDDGQEYSIPYYEPPHADVDDDIVVDGKLDDKLYSQLNWLDLQYNAAGLDIDIHATLYPSTTGFFLAFNVSDPLVYISKQRGSSYNTGVELYLAAGGTTVADGNLYEVSMHADGSYGQRIVRGNQYAEYSTSESNSIYVKGSVIGDPINSGTSDGYIIEAFVPFSFFETLDDIPSYWYMNIALIRTFSTSAEDGRLWYDLGKELHGAGWNNQSTYWQFDNTGLKGFKVTVEKNAGGSIVVPSVVPNGDKVNIVIKPDEDKRLKKLELNGENYLTKFTEIETDKATILLNRVDEDLKIVAEFEDIPSTKYSITGLLTYDGSSLTSEMIDDLDVRFISGARLYEGRMLSNGGFTVNAPSGEGELIFRSHSGAYDAYKETINLSSRITNKFIDISPEQYGPYRTVYADDVVIRSGNTTYIDQTNSFATISTHQTLFFKLSYSGLLVDEHDNINHTPTDGRVEHEFMAFNNMMNTFLRTEDGDPSLDVPNYIFQIVHWDLKWVIKTWFCGDSSYQKEMTLNELKALQSKGIEFATDFRGNEFTVYMKEGSTYISIFDGKDTQYGPNVAVKVVRTYLENQIQEGAWTLSEIKLTSRAPGSELVF